MPDVSRSNSSRSDTCSRPRVSFNRNVHVKRINAPKTANAYSLSPDGNSFIPTSVRRERPLTKKEMTEEAEVVLKQVDKLRCMATSNLQLEEEKPIVKKKKKESSLSLIKKNFEKTEKLKNSSSDIDSGSSQEYRIYRVNNPINNNNNVNSTNTKTDFKLQHTAVNQKNKKKNKYDFLSLDRKRMRKKKKEYLDYLSLERNNELLNKFLEKKSNKKPASEFFGEKDNIGEDLTSVTKSKRNQEEQCVKDVSEEFAPKKNQCHLKVEHAPCQVETKIENNIEKMIRKLTENDSVKLTRNTGKVAIKEPKSDTCHNNNRPFSYTSNEKSDLELKLGSTMVESLGRCNDLKSTSPTNDVIYAQVIIGGRDGNTQKATVNERVAGNEVGRVFVGENLKQYDVGLNYKINNTGRNVCETNTVKSEEMWQKNGENFLEKENYTNCYNNYSHETCEETQDSTDMLYRRSIEKEITLQNPLNQDFTKVINAVPKNSNKSSADLHDLSIRREILLSRSESQAKERFNSLRRLQEPNRLRRRLSNLNENRIENRKPRNDVSQPREDKKVNEKISNIPRRSHKETEILETTNKKKREPKTDSFSKDKEDKWKNSDKNHVIKTDDDDNILRKLSRLGKSKSFTQDKSKNKGMEKVKMLFKKKKEEKTLEDEDDPLTSRYTVYHGSDIDLTDKSRESSPKRAVSRASLMKTPNFERKQLPTPSSVNSMGRLNKINNEKNKEFKKEPTLKKQDKKEKKKLDDAPYELNPSKSSNLRFFGDTDQESTTNEIYPSGIKPKYEIGHAEKFTDSDSDYLIVSSRPESQTKSNSKISSSKKYKSKCDLDKPDYGLQQMNYGLQTTFNKFENHWPEQREHSSVKNESNESKYKTSVVRSKSSLSKPSKVENKEKLRNLKSTPIITVTSSDEPPTRKVASQGNLYGTDEKKGGRRKNYDSSAESATEGDSSQHSTRSMIYLHAATVGDIPKPRNSSRREKRSQSKEELSSLVNNNVIATPTKRTLSRSFSVLAPWRPKHNKDQIVYYNSADSNKSKPPTGSTKYKKNSSKDSNEIKFNTIGKENRRRKDLLR